MCHCLTYHDGSLLAVVVVKLQHIFEGKITDHVRVQDEEGLVVDVEKVSGQRQGARCTQTHKMFNPFSYIIILNF